MGGEATIVADSVEIHFVFVFYGDPGKIEEAMRDFEKGEKYLRN